MKTFIFTIDNGALSIKRTATGRDMWAAWESLGYTRAASFKIIEWSEVPPLPKVEGEAMARYRVINTTTGTDELDCADLGLAVTAADKFRMESVEARGNHHFAVLKTELVFHTDPKVKPYG